jgi:hypothetical protein
MPRSCCCGASEKSGASDNEMPGSGEVPASDAAAATASLILNDPLGRRGPFPRGWRGCWRDPPGGGKDRGQLSPGSRGFWSTIIRGLVRPLRRGAGVAGDAHRLETAMIVDRCTPRRGCGDPQCCFRRSAALWAGDDADVGPGLTPRRTAPRPGRRTSAGAPGGGGKCLVLRLL